jgi:hypothetical protein
LPELVAAVERRRARRRWLSGGLAVAAAVTALVVAVGVWGLPASSPSPGGGLALSPVTETAISARAQLSDEPWGTQIALSCTYDRSSPYARTGQTYALLVVDDAGRSQQVATWRVLPNGVSNVTGSVGWDKAHIAEVEIQTLDGSPVLRLVT